MGLLRVLLALSVLFEHTGGIGGYWMIGGPLAVQAFFIISGFYMGLVLNERYDQPALNKAFYLNRAIRIYSIYFLFLALYLGAFVLVHLKTGHSPFDPYLSGLISGPEKAGLGLLNLTVIGQDLPLWLRIDDGHLAWTAQAFGTGPLDVFHFMAIPVAWSLSLELCFYLIAPFIVRRPWPQIALLLATSTLLRIAAAVLGYTADPFSYRFFPFELAWFLAGVLAYKAWAAGHARWEGQGARLLALAVPAATLAYPWLLGSWSEAAFFVPARIGFLVLVAAALPAIHQWSRNSAFDRQIGELSYPLYLGQLLVLGLLAGWPILAESTTARTLAVALVSLALGVLLALAGGLIWLRESPEVPMQQGRRLMDAVGWAALLPQMLASLGAVFLAAGVGKAVGGVVSGVIPADSRVLAVAAFGLGMALFTMVMGNAFAAFPVMMAAIGMPLLIQHYHGDPAVIAAVGMLAGFCGTLMTPMAANFNIVPAALLDLKDRNAVVKAQVPTALPLLAFNIVLIAWVAFP